MKKISIVLLLACSFLGIAQERPEMNELPPLEEGLGIPVINRIPAIATDRPDFSESARIVPTGWLQYEGGYQYAHSEERLSATEITDVHQFEEVLRFGVNHRFEARAIINANTRRVDLQNNWNTPTRLTGVSPITIGFKYNLLEETDWRPHVTWKSHLILPWIAGGDYRVPTQGNLAFHQQRILLEKRLTHYLSLASNIGVSGGMTGSNGFINEGLFSLAAGLDLGNDYGMYVEYFTTAKVAGVQFLSSPFFDGGFTKLLSNDLQLDIYAGIDLSPYVGSRRNTSGFFFGTGVSYRLPLAAYLN